MRTFWFFIAVLVLAGALLAVLSESPSETPVESQNLTVDPTQDLASELAAASEERLEAVEPEIASPEIASPEIASPEIASPEIATDGEEPENNSGALTAGLDREIPHATIKPGNIQVIDDEQLSVDGDFTLRGRGTKEFPYEPSWDYLFSAADTYQPRLDEHEIPQRIALLDGKWVRISGYTAFPLVVGETSEMLVMLNKWDGCCIGVPPTPFDAIEVRLTQPVDRGPKHQINFGSVTGKMKVDPYLIENWLVGLYILEESSLSTDL